MRKSLQRSLLFVTTICGLSVTCLTDMSRNGYRFVRKNLKRSLMMCEILDFTGSD